MGNPKAEEKKLFVERSRSVTGAAYNFALDFITEEITSYAVLHNKADRVKHSIIPLVIDT